MIQRTCQHPAYGTGYLVSFDQQSQRGHFIFPNPPGLALRRSQVMPYADLNLVDGEWTVDHPELYSTEASAA